MISEAVARNRPRWVSTLAILSLIASGAGVLSLFFFPREPTFVRRFGDFSWVELVISGGLLALLLAGMIMLRRSSRGALWFVMAVFVLAGGSVVERLLTRNLGALVYDFGLVGIIVLVFWPSVVFLMSGMILVYLWGLDKRGALS